MANKTVGTIIDTIKEATKKKSSGYDTTATVTRVEGNTAWVHIPGGVDETPAELTINAKVGDKVQVRVSNGSAFLVGNGSAPPTDDGTAITAINYAKVANEAANSAVNDAGIAREAAASASAAASRAETHATAAETAAGTAKQAADTALVELANVQDVAGVLEWITNHGEMRSQAGGTFNPDEVYFVLDPNGDYEVQGSNYSIVSEPKAEDIDDYFVLNVDESIQNYVSTHLALTGEGLYVMKDDTEWKVLVGDDGVYIIDGTSGVDINVAKYKDAITLGEDNGSQSYLYANYHSLQLIDREGSEYIFFSDLREKDGSYKEGAYFSDYVERYKLEATPYDIIELKVNGAEVTSGYSIEGDEIVFNPRLPRGSNVSVWYYPDAVDKDKLRAFTIGSRDPSNGVGIITTTIGRGLLALYENQTVIGRFNLNNPNSAFEIGNGTDIYLEDKSNAFDVNWNGEARLMLDTSAASGTTDGDLYRSIQSLGWTNDVIDPYI